MLSQDGGTLVVTDGGGELRDWNIAGPRPPTELGPPLIPSTNMGSGGVLAVSADGSAVVGNADMDGTSVFLWYLDVLADVDALCAMPPALTRANWSQYVPCLPYSPPCGTGALARADDHAP
jgi:hypothetical protein